MVDQVESDSPASLCPWRGQNAVEPIRPGISTHPHNLRGFQRTI